MKIRYVTTHSDAQKMASQGYEPIECAFGKDSVMGPFNMDHHGDESWREGVALRACRDHYGALQEKPFFVVTGAPDADAVLAIIALAGLVPQDGIPHAFSNLVNRRDLNPIDINLLEEPFGEELLVFNSLRKEWTAEGWHTAIQAMCSILTDGLTEEQREDVRREEERRIEMAESAVVEDFDSDVLLVEGSVWGFDRWYQRARIVVAYNADQRRVTIGVKDEKDAELWLGHNGLNNVYPLLGEGWGGRETIGGSPRDQVFSFEDARKAATAIKKLVDDRDEWRIRRVYAEQDMDEDLEAYYAAKLWPHLRGGRA